MLQSQVQNRDKSPFSNFCADICSNLKRWKNICKNGQTGESKDGSKMNMKILGIVFQTTTNAHSSQMILTHETWNVSSWRSIYEIDHHVWKPWTWFYETGLYKSQNTMVLQWSTLSPHSKTFLGSNLRAELRIWESDSGLLWLRMVIYPVMDWQLGLAAAAHGPQRLSSADNKRNVKMVATLSTQIIVCWGPAKAAPAPLFCCICIGATGCHHPGLIQIRAVHKTCTKCCHYSTKRELCTAVCQKNQNHGLRVAERNQPTPTHHWFEKIC